MQRSYVNLLVSRYSATGPSEFRMALRAGLIDLASKLEQAEKKVRDRQREDT